MKNVVEVFDDVPRAGTFMIAKGFGREHKYLLELIKDYREDFEEFGGLKPRKVMTAGRPAEEFWLNEEQALLLGAYMRNSQQVREFKIRLVREFKSLKDRVNELSAQKSRPDYQVARDAGKLVRKDTTDAMKEFVAYAEAQGSKNAQRYYGNISKMLNGMLFIVQGHYKNVRDVLTVRQLMTVSSAEQIIDRGLVEGMRNKKYYKDIYQDIRSRVQLFADMHGKSDVIGGYLSEDTEKGEVQRR